MSGNTSIKTAGDFYRLVPTITVPQTSLNEVFNAMRFVIAGPGGVNARLILQWNDYAKRGFSHYIPHFSITSNLT